MPTDQTVSEICGALGITILPRNQRRSMLGELETVAEQTITRLISDHGAGHAIFVLRAIAETTNNRTELVAPTILAVSDIVRAHPEWAEDRAGDFLDALDQVPLAEIRAAVKRNRIAVPIRQAVATVAFLRLAAILSPEPRLI